MLTSHLVNDLYPEWDEFYLAICDICGIIIRPQALEKHLATKHRISGQPSPQNQKQAPKLEHSNSSNHNNGLPSNNNHNSSTSENGHCKNHNNSVVNSGDSKPQNGTTTTQQPTTIHPKLWGGKHALDSPPEPAIKRRPCDWVKVRRAPDTSLLASSSLISSSPASLTEEASSKYQDRKWRNTFNVLSDTFF